MIINTHKNFSRDNNKIILIIPSLSFGGAERIISYLANYWFEKGKEIIIVLTGLEAYGEQYYINKKIKLIRLFKKNSSRRFLVFKTFLRLFFLLRQEKPSNLISFLTPTNIISIIPCKLLNIRCIVSERNDPELSSYGFKFNILRYFLYRFSYKVVVQTERHRRYLLKKVPGNYSVIPNFIDKNEEDIFKKKGKFLISVGRLVYQKGHDFGIKAFAEISHLIPEWKLIIVGEGSEKDNLKFLINKYKLNNRIILEGSVKDVISLIKKAKIGLQLSRFEGFPNSLLEKMSVGLPVISSKEAGYMLIKNNYNGIIIDSKNPKTIGKKIYSLIKNENLQKKLSKNAKLRANDFAPEIIMPKWEKLLKKE